MSADNPYRYVGEKLLEPAGPELWPLAILYFDTTTRGLKVAIASVGAELIVGHGKKIGIRMENEARHMVQQMKAQGTARKEVPDGTYKDSGS